MRTNATEALELPPPEQTEALQHASSEWQMAALEWWESHMGPAQKTNGGRPKIHRAKALAWLHATDHQLRAATGAGWEQFCLPADEASWPPPGSRPSIMVSIDQGPDGWSAVHFLQNRLSCNMWLTPDPSHRVWNDCELAIRDMRLWSQCLTGIICLNADQGPWANARWWEEARQGVAEYMQIANTNCPLFVGLYKFIVFETGQTHRLGEEGLPEEIFGNLGACVERKMPRVGMSRWFQYIDSMQEYTGMWSQRLLVYLYLCVQLGLHRSGNAYLAMKNKFNGRCEEDDVQKSTTGGDREEIRKARLACKNTIEFVSMVLTDRDAWSINRGIVLACQPLRKWHGMQNQRNRSSAAAADFHRDMAMGEGSKAVVETLRLLCTDTLWEEMGLTVGKAAMEEFGDQVIVEDPRVLSQDDLVHKIAGLCMALACRRSRSLRSYEDGYPNSFAGLLDTAGAPRVLDRMRADKEAWAALSALDGRFWQRLKLRSDMARPHTKQIFALAEESNFAPNDSLVSFVRQQVSGINQTKIVEDALRLERMEETSTSFNKARSGARVWDCVVRSELGHEVHKWEPLPWGCEIIPKGYKDKPLHALFEPRPRESPASYRELASRAAQTQWHSPKPSLAIQSQEDMALAKHCLANDCWEEAARSSWLSIMSKGTNLCIRKKGNANPWWFSFGTMGGMAILGWRARSEPVGKGRKMHWVPDLTATAEWLVMLDPAEWEGFVYTWLSPLHVQLLAGGRKRPSGVLASVVTGPAPLWEIAALSAFWEVPKVGLSQICRHLGVEMSAGDSLPTLLQRLAKHFLGDRLTDEVLANILQKRVHQKDELLAFLASDEAKDLLSQDDAAEVAKSNEASDAWKHEQGIVVKELKSIRTKIAAGKSSGKGGRNQLGGKGSLNRRYPKRVIMPSGAMPVDDLKLLLPPGASLCRDENNQRWLVSCLGERKSRSWGIHGYNESGIMVAQLAWQVWESSGFDPCPVEGLMDLKFDAA